MAATTFSGPVTSTGGFVGALTGNVVGNVQGVVLGNVPVQATAATLTVTAAEHAGRFVTLSRAAGIAVTLPAATGSGSVYSFLVITAITSNSTTIKVANATDVMTGSAYVITDNGGGAVIGFRTAADSDTVTMNGTTLGGVRGDMVVLVDVAAGLYDVHMETSATGTEATPFSATVS